MVEMGYITEEEAKMSFDDYWDGFDYTRVSLSAWFTREDKARWFSEYVRRELEEKMLGTMDIYADGYTVHTTCDLRHQSIAEAEVQEYIEIANNRVDRISSIRNVPSAKYANIASILALTCDVSSLHISEKMVRHKANTYYDSDIAPLVDILSAFAGSEPLKKLSKQQVVRRRADSSKNIVEGTMICIENESGYITSIVGGGSFHEGNQLIRATQSKLPVGSTFKPLLYSAAIDSRKVTAATMLEDTPQVFVTPDGVQYIPNNFSGKWKGTVLLYEALPISLNIPAVSILDTVGFEPTIRRAAALVGIDDENEIEKTFERVYPLALGISSITPLQLARAFTIFANQGRAVEPYAIRRVENRNGNIVLDIEKEMRVAAQRKGSDIQVVSPQNAYIITDLLKRTLTLGTMYGSTKGGQKFVYKDANTGKTFKMPMAGKTGTTQNFTDSWTAAYSPYYTTVAWFGFDVRGQSLGPQSTGAGLASYAVADYMQEIHKGKAFKDFVRPDKGLRRVRVCKVSGDIPTEKCHDGTVDLWFLTGTEPKQKCTLHESSEQLERLSIDRMIHARDILRSTVQDLDDGLEIDPNVFREWQYEDEDIPNEEEITEEENGNEEKEMDDTEVSEESKENEEKENEEKSEDDDESEVNPWL